MVEAVGSVCNTEWLDGNGLDLTDGVLTDNQLGSWARRAPSPSGTSRGSPTRCFDDVPRRVEHWSMPTDTAKRAAATLAARLRGEQPDPTPFAPVPVVLERPARPAVPELRLARRSARRFGSRRATSPTSAAGVLTTHHRGGRHVGTVALNLPPARQRGLREALVALATTQ